MKKGCLIFGGIFGVIAVIAIVALIWGTGIYNNMVGKDEKVQVQWANVQNTYQKRLDLIPNLVSTVKGAADFEKSTLEAVIGARAKATQTTIDPTNITPEKIAQFQQVQGELSSALSRLLVTVERYPELKANQNFLALQTELSSIENEILFERQKYNVSAGDFNTYVRTVPNNLVANFTGMDEKAKFEADKGAENAPKVEF